MAPGPFLKRRLEGAHLAFVVNTDWFFLSHRLPLAEEARRLGARVSVITGDTGASERIRELGFGFHPLPILPGSRSPAADLRTYRTLARYYRELAPDLVHHVTLKPVVYGSLAARRGKAAASGSTLVRGKDHGRERLTSPGSASARDVVTRPAVVNAVSGLGYAFSGNGRWSPTRAALIRLLRAAVGNGRTFVIFQNAQDRAFFRERILPNEDRVVTIRGSGVDTGRFVPADEPEDGPLQVVFLGRTLRSKGVEVFVEAARALRDRGGGAGEDGDGERRAIRFVIAGAPDPGNPDSVSKAALRRWHEEGCVEWAGWVDDVPALLRRSHVVALPSWYGEGVPRALIEGAASGRALVAAEGGGAREIVRPGWNGLLVPPRDPAALLRAVESLAADPVLRRRMGGRGREIVEEGFALDGVVAATMEVYRTALGMGAE